ncbi:MAG: hypothetical protein KDK63_03665, partial [Chlamydiia bacterium]|nr:hypothetical protein [Chlamydiia bacterium]
NWAKASKEQRQKGLAIVKQLIPNYTAIQYGAFASELDSQQIIDCFGRGIDAAKMHLAMNFSLDEIEWDDTVVGILKGEALLQWLNRNEFNQEGLERFLDVSDNHALIPQLNDPLKKDAVAYFCDNPKLKPPACLKGHCTTAQYRKLFGYSVWEKLGVFLLILAGIFGLYHLYQRRKKS